MRHRRALSSQTETRLRSYALAAAGCGIGLLASAQPSEGQIVYTPAHVVITNCCGASYNLDLNGDGITEFAFGGTTNLYAWFYVVGRHNDARVVGFQSPGGSGCYANALQAGVVIGFQRPTCSQAQPGSMAREWTNESDRYLGLTFKIDNEIHYGWARLSVRVNGNRVTAHLTGYAYETIANQTIKTGQISDGDAGADVFSSEEALSEGGRELGSLGKLAIGSSHPAD